MGKNPAVNSIMAYAAGVQNLLAQSAGDEFAEMRETVTRHIETVFLPIGEDIQSPHYMTKEDSVGHGIRGYINLVEYAAQKKAGSLNGKVEGRVLGGSFSEASPLDASHHFWAKQCQEFSESSARIADRLFNIANTPHSRYRVILAAMTSLSELVEAASQSGHAIDTAPYKKDIIKICKSHGMDRSDHAPHEQVYGFWASYDAR